MFPPSHMFRSLQSEPPPPYNEVYCDQETLPPEYTDIVQSITSTTTTPTDVNDVDANNEL